MNTQHRSNREEGLEQLVEAMRSEDCGKLHASVKRKKKKVDEKHATAKCDHCDGTGNHGDKECKKCGGDGWIDAKDVVKEADNPFGGDDSAGSTTTTEEVLGQVYKEIDEYMTTAVFTVGGEDLKDNVLAIVKQYLVDNPAAVSAAPSRPSRPPSSPARLSQSPHKPSGMSGPGMMP